VEEEIEKLLKRTKEIDKNEDFLYGDNNISSRILEEVKDREYLLKRLGKAKE
jgi:UDP-N-acetylglucosamine 2-epimerase